MVILDLGINFGSLQCCGSSQVNQERVKPSQFGCRQITIITILKLFIMPLIGIPLFFTYFDNGLIKDKLLLFLYWFMVAAPNAINVIIVCGIKNTKVNKILTLHYRKKKQVYYWFGNTYYQV